MDHHKKLHNRCSLLDLPLEIRRKIYALAIPHSRLCVRHVNSTDWRMARSDRTGLPAILSTCKSIYIEATPLWYRKATLELIPCQQSPHDIRSVRQYLKQHDQDVAFCPARLLVQIRNVHIYSDQDFLLYDASFTAVLHWSIANTSAENIFLTRHARQHLKHWEPSTLDLTGLVYNRLSHHVGPRVIDILLEVFSKRVRIASTFSRAKMKEVECFDLYHFTRHGAGLEATLSRVSTDLTGKQSILDQDCTKEIQQKDGWQSALRDSVLNAAYEENVIQFWRRIVIMPASWTSFSAPTYSKIH